MQPSCIRYVPRCLPRCALILAILVPPNDCPLIIPCPVSWPGLAHISLALSSRLWPKCISTWVISTVCWSVLNEAACRNVCTVCGLTESTLCQNRRTDRGSGLSRAICTCLVVGQCTRVFLSCQ